MSETTGPSDDHDPTGAASRDPIDLLRRPPSDWRSTVVSSARHIAATLRDRVRTPFPVALVGLVVAGAVGIVGYLAVHGASSSGPAIPMTRPGRASETIGPGSSVGPTSKAPAVASVESNSATPGTAVVTIWIDVTGAVVRPGLVAVRDGARVAELINLADGFSADADVDRVNLAARVHDGERLYVPRRGESAAPPVIAGTGSAAGDGNGVGGVGPTTTTPPDPVDLNTASAEQLDTLPGVGPATSAAIIDYRAQHGPFHSVDDLAQVRGIGKAKLDQLRSHLVVR